MSKQKKSLINFFTNNILKKKLIVMFVFVIVLSILCSKLIYNNFLQNSPIDNINTTTDNTNIVAQSIGNSKDQTYNNINNQVHSEEHKFDNVALINDDIGVPVLYYHSITEPANNEVTLAPKNLKAQLKYIKDQGYITLTMNELRNYLLNNSPIPEKSIVITFDDGYMDNYINAFPILKEFHMDATIFCITSDLDGSYYLSTEAIKEMSDYGIDIESHTVNHPKLGKLTYEEQLAELKDSKKTLESITGKPINSIAYPFGDFNDDSIKAVKNAGYTLAFTTHRGLADRIDNPLKLDRIYISSTYDINTFKEVLTKTKK